MTATEERLFDSFLIVGLSTSSGPSLSSTFSLVEHSSVPVDNDLDFGSVATASSAGEVTSSILYRFPPETSSSYSSSSLNPKSLCDFCFPDLDSFRSKKAGKKWKIKRETFSFVLTDTKGGKRWGYCYRCMSPVTSMPICFCLVSFTPCVGFYSQLVQKLSQIEERTKGNFTLYHPLLEDLYSRTLPAPGDSLVLSLPAQLAFSQEMGKDKKKAKEVFLSDEQMFDPEVEQWTFSRPEDNDWMMDDINVLPLVRFLSPSNIVAVFTSLLVERRIIFVADRLSALSSCVQAAAALLYPFSWQHIFIPVLPQSLLSFACAPMPYMIGVLRSSVTELKKMSDAMEEIVVVDIDNNRFYAPPELLDKRLLPSYLSDPLLHSLEIASKEVRQTLGPLNSYFHRKKEDKKQHKMKRIEEKLERDIRYDLGNAFVGFFIDLLGNYKDFILRSQTETEAVKMEGNFDRKGFIDAQPEEVRPLLALMVQSQLFFMFIEDRKKKEVEDKRRNRQGKAWSDRERLGDDPSQINSILQRNKNLSSSGSCIASFSSSSSSTSSSPSSSRSSSPISSSPSSPSSSYTAFPLRPSATHTTISSSTVSFALSSSSELIPNQDDQSAKTSYELRAAQRKLWLQSRFSMYENGEISREDLAKRWKEIEKEEKRMEKEKEKALKKKTKKKADGIERSGPDQIPQREEIVLLLDRFHQKKMSGERDRELDRKLGHSESNTALADERASDRSLSSSSSSTRSLTSSDGAARKRSLTSLSFSGSRSTKADAIKNSASATSLISSSPSPKQPQQRLNPIMRVSAEKRTDGSRSESTSPYSPITSPSPRNIFTPSASTTLITHATTKHTAALASSSLPLPRSSTVTIPQSSPRSANASPSLSPSSPSVLPASSPSSPSFVRPLPPVKLASSSSGISPSSRSLSSSSSFTSFSVPRTTSNSASSSLSSSSSTTSGPRVSFNNLASSSSSSPSSSLASLLSPRNHSHQSSSSSAALSSSASGMRPLPPIPLQRSHSHRATTTSSSILGSATPNLPSPPPPPVPPRALPSIDRIRSQLTRTTKKQDDDPDHISVLPSKSKDKEQKKDKRKDKLDRHAPAQGLTPDEARRIQMLLDRGWKEEKDKLKRDKEGGKKEKKDKKEKKLKEEGKGAKNPKKNALSRMTSEDRRAFDDDLEIVFELPLTRKRSNSDGVVQTDRDAARGRVKEPASTAALEGGKNGRLTDAVTLHSGYLLKKNGSGKSKNDWQRIYCVLSTRRLSFYQAKGDTEAVLRLELKSLNLATFYRNISSLMIYDRVNCFELALAEGSSTKQIHLATGSLEEGRTWSEALQKAAVPCRLA